MTYNVGPDISGVATGREALKVKRMVYPFEGLNDRSMMTSVPDLG